jgi:hypothetical protein
LKYVLVYKASDRAVEKTDNFANCKYKCIASAEIPLHSSDAVLFDLAPYYKTSKFPLLREPSLTHQIWIVGIVEPPTVYGPNSFKDFTNIFNWSLSYRKDSDVYWPAGSFDPLLPNESYELPTAESIKDKKLVAAMISHCTGDRMDYIEEIQKHLSLDYYGLCGDLDCGRNCNYTTLAKDYKFWLAFENSFCVDYVSEKLFEPLKYGMVPVVYGMGSYAELAPPGSFINSRDFKTPKELAQYLLYLDSHTEEYLKYFDWKKGFRILRTKERWSRLWCQLCTKIHESSTTVLNPKWYENFGEWYNRNGTNSSVCLTPKSKVRNHSMSTYRVRSRSRS